MGILLILNLMILKEMIAQHQRRAVADVSSVCKCAGGRKPKTVGQRSASTWHIARADAAKASRLLSPRTPRDRELVLKCCWLARTRFSEHWLWDAVYGVVHATEPIRNPMAYWQTILERKTPDFWRIVAGVQLPEAEGGA
jgi:hypothetical protein